MLLTVWCLCLPAARAAGDQLKIKFFKAGKADAFLLRTPNHTVLLDTAEADDGEKIAAYLREKNITRLDVMILTHLDKGHIGAAPHLLGQVTVDKVYLMPRYEKQSNAANALFGALEAAKITPEYVQSEAAFELDGVHFRLMAPQNVPQTVGQEDEDNDYSLVVSVRHGSNRFLFGGDILSPRMEQLLQSGQDLRHTLLKAPNHGRNADALARFVQAVQPQYAVITCSQKNPPAGAVLELLSHLNIKTYLTMDGDIALTSDGQTITFKQ